MQEIAKRKEMLRSAFSSWSFEEKSDANRMLNGPSTLALTMPLPMKTRSLDEESQSARNEIRSLDSSRMQLIMNPMKKRISREEVFANPL